MNSDEQKMKQSLALRSAALAWDYKISRSVHVRRRTRNRVIVSCATGFLAAVVCVILVTGVFNNNVSPSSAYIDFVYGQVEGVSELSYQRTNSEMLQDVLCSR